MFDVYIRYMANLKILSPRYFSWSFYEQNGLFLIKNKKSTATLVFICQNKFNVNFLMLLHNGSKSCMSLTARSAQIFER